MELSGVWIAVLSSALGGTAVGATRYLAGALDPITIGAIRFGGGCLILAPVALWRGERWPHRRDWPAVAALGLLFFGLFPVLFNAALIYTTAARGALALSTLPLLTLLAGSLLGVEQPSLRKLAGLLVAMAGVALSLGSSLSSAPADAWRGDLLMLAAAGCMALYNVWSRPFIARSSAIAYAAFGMGIGAACLIVFSLASGGVDQMLRLNHAQWVAAAYLAIVCGALIFFLWAYALGRAAPSLVAASVTVNPVSASIFGIVLLGEAISVNLLIGLVAVLAGITIASGARLSRAK